MTQSQRANLLRSIKKLARASVSRFIPACFAALFGLSQAFASGSAEAHHGSIGDLVGPWINFLVYLVLLVTLVRKPIRNSWVARREQIVKDVADATSEMESAEHELSSVETLTKNLTNEQAKAREEILKQGELEAASIEAAAREKAARIKSQVRDLLDGESRSAQANFRAALVAKAVELSKARFQSGEFAARQGAYVDAAVDRAKKLAR